MGLTILSCPYCGHRAIVRRDAFEAKAAAHLAKCAVARRERGEP